MAKMKIKFTGPNANSGEWNPPTDPFADQSREHPIDRRKAACPSCEKKLMKIPSGKTKCPHCGEMMFVRTTPRDHARVVVTSAEADRIDEDWAVIRNTCDPNFAHLANRAEIDQERERLKQAFAGRDCGEPSDDDVKWGLLTKMAARHASEGNWGLSRNIYLMMADFLTRRWNLKDGLKLYLYVCVLDLNGAQNRAGISEEMLKKFPFFDATMPTLAPTVVNQVRIIARKLRLSTDDVQMLFLNAASVTQFSASPVKCWEVLTFALEGKINLDDQPNCFKQIRSLLMHHADHE